MPNEGQNKQPWFPNFGNGPPILGATDQDRPWMDTGTLIFYIFDAAANVWRAVGEGSGLAVVSPVLNNSAVSVANAALIQNALNAGGDIFVEGNGIAYITGQLIMGSNTNLMVSPTLEIRQATINPGTNLLVNKSYKQNVFTAVVLTWVSGLICSVAWANHGRSVGDPIWITGTNGTTDSAFCGVFTISSVTNSGNFVINLRRLPAAVPAGAINATLADRNVYVSGGLWNYNGTQVTPPNSMGAFGVLFAGVQNLCLRQMRFTDTPKYCISLGAISEFICDELTSYNTSSDGFKGYGPIWDGQVSNCLFDCGDDSVSFNPVNPAAFSQYEFTNGGDVLNVKIENIRSSEAVNGSTVAIYGQAAFVIDDILIDRVNGRCTNNAQVRVDLGDSAVASTIRGIRIKNINQQQDTSQLAIQVNGANLTIDMLEIDGFTTAFDFPAGHISYSIDFNACHIRSALVKNCKCYFPTATYSFLHVNCAIDKLTLSDSYFDSVAIGDGRCVELAGGGSIVFVDVTRIETNDVLVVVYNGNTSTPIIQIRESSLNTAQGVTCPAANNPCTVYLRDNLWSGAFQGLLRDVGASVVIYADGNVLTNASVFLALFSSPSITMYGWDAQVDVTLLARVSGAFCFNTNGAAGTIPAAGLVFCQGVAAGSWKYMADTTKNF